MVVAVVLTCSGCGAEVDATEEGRCAHCRMLDRGDDALLTHDSRGWHDGYEKAWVLRPAVDPGGRRNRSRFAQHLTQVEKRKPCECGCQMDAVTKAEPQPDQTPAVVPPRAPAQRIRSEEELLDLIRQWVADFCEPPSIEQWKAKRRERGLPSWTVISARFGTWNQAIRAAGFEPYLGGRRNRRGWKPKPIAGTSSTVKHHEHQADDTPLDRLAAIRREAGLE